MRTLFIVFLLANAALFGLGQGWFGQPPSLRDRDPARLAQQVRADAITVHPLTQDRPEGRPASPPPDAGAAPVAPPAQETAPADAAPANPPPAPEPQGEPLAPPPPVPDSPAAPDAPAPSSSGEPSGVPPVVAPAAGTPALLAVPVSAIAQGRCVQWGSFDEDELARARQWSAGTLPGVAVDVRREPARAAHMVIVPPQASADAAQALAGRLQRRGVADIFVIQAAGPYRHAISLGMFSSAEGAQRRLQALQSQGVRDTRIVTRNASGARAWLVLNKVGEAEQRALSTAAARFPRQTLGHCG